MSADNSSIVTDTVGSNSRHQVLHLGSNAKFVHVCTDDEQPHFRSSHFGETLHRTLEVFFLTSILTAYIILYMHRVYTELQNKENSHI